MSGHGHDHAPSADADRRWLTIALALIVAFMCAELVAGLLANSLALLSDAAHMLTDAASIALALGAARLAARPATGAPTFGWGRAEILAAQLNGVSLLVLAAVITWEAVARLANPPDVDGALVIVVGVLGAGVNVAAAWALSRAERRSLNIEGARAHVLADLYASIGAVVAGLAVVLWGARVADGLAGLLVAALMVRSGWALVRDSGRVLLEASPAAADTQAIGRALSAAPGVLDVHDLHLWEITSGFPALSAHVTVSEQTDCHDLRRSLQRVLSDRFAIEHATLQVDHAGTARAVSFGCRVGCC
jgi:cobalt-zinc-cadmium efflux system protein